MILLAEELMPNASLGRNRWKIACGSKVGPGKTATSAMSAEWALQSGDRIARPIIAG
jgi:hypothetical protein